MKYDTKGFLMPKIHHAFEVRVSSIANLRDLTSGSNLKASSTLSSTRSKMIKGTSGKTVQKGRNKRW